MSQTSLFPSKLNRSMGFAFAAGLGAWAIGHWVVFWSAGGSGLAQFPMILTAAAGVVAWKNTLPFLKGTPTFEARAEGFSVMGGPVQPWESYRGVRATQLRIGLFPVPTDLKVLVKRRGPIPKKLSIPFTHLPGWPEDSVKRIEGLAAQGRAGQFGEKTTQTWSELTAQLATAAQGRKSGAPADRAAAPNLRPAQTRPTQRPMRKQPILSPAQDGGPIRSKKRLFAGKVI